MTEPTLATINEFNQRIIELSSGLVPLHEKADIYFEDDESNHEMTALLNAFNSFNRESLSVQALALFEEMVNSVKKFDNFLDEEFQNNQKHNKAIEQQISDIKSMLFEQYTDSEVVGMTYRLKVSLSKLPASVADNLLLCYKALGFTYITVTSNSHLVHFDPSLHGLEFKRNILKKFTEISSVKCPQLSNYMLTEYHKDKALTPDEIVDVLLSKR